MTDRSPIVAFGLKATTVALKAKTDQLQTSDKLDLAMACLEWLGDNQKVREAVIAFNTIVDANPVVAADMLQALAANLVPNSEPWRGEEVLQKIEEERVEADAESGNVVEFDWQKRADLQ